MLVQRILYNINNIPKIRLKCYVYKALHLKLFCFFVFLFVCFFVCLFFVHLSVLKRQICFLLTFFFFLLVFLMHNYEIFRNIENKFQQFQSLQIPGKHKQTNKNKTKLLKLLVIAKKCRIWPTPCWNHAVLNDILIQNLKYSNFYKKKNK